jgi:hypothetical protein
MHAKFVWPSSNDQMLNSREKRQGLSTYLQFNYLHSNHSLQIIQFSLKGVRCVITSQRIPFSLISVLLIFKCMYLNVLSASPALSHITITKSAATLQRRDATCCLRFLQNNYGVLNKNILDLIGPGVCNFSVTTSDFDIFVPELLPALFIEFSTLLSFIPPSSFLFISELFRRRLCFGLLTFPSNEWS